MARSLRWLFRTAARTDDSPTDGELLGRFTSAADQAAFELLVRRHASAVWAACRQVLRNDADADDAFQAVFLTLARHAGAIRERRTLGGWLHRVAVNAALKLRARRRATAPLDDVPGRPAAVDDATEHLHEELANLPPAFREVLVAVDLEGYTHTDAAKVLGWPVGTVSGRLVRARAELRKRLERRGVTAALVVATVSGSSIRAAVEVAVGAVVAPPVVVSLSTEVWAMIVTARRRLVGVVAAGLLGTALLAGAGVVAVAQTPKASPNTADKKPNEPARKPGGERKPVEKVEDLPEVQLLDADSAEVTLAKKMIQLQLKRRSLIEQKIEAGQFTGAANYIQITDTLAELTAAVEEAYPEPKDQLPWFEFRFAELVRWEKYNAVRIKEGVEEPQLGPQVRAAMLKAELALLKVQKKVKK